MSTKNSLNYGRVRLWASTTLAFLTLTLLAAGGVSATCPTTAGASPVEIALIDIDGNSVPDIHSNDKERNEHARISSALATTLGVPDPDGGDVLPQIRVVVDNKPLPNQEKGTGVFSVFEIFNDEDERVEIYTREDTDDEDSGYYRLFETTEVTDFTAVDVTVYAEAPSKTTTKVNGGTPTVVEHFCEPHSGTYTEEVHIRTDARFALFVPHGGGIEDGTSEQISTIETVLATTWGVDANTWNTPGTWFNNQNESEHWHITSKEVSEDGHPGLANLLQESQYDNDRDFQYVASLHGMKFSKEGLVIGGRAHREAKCLIASRIRQRMAAESEDLPAIYIWNYDKDFDQSIELAHSDETLITDPDERGSDPGVSGTSKDNVVNRFSPNDTGEAGYGDIQIEQSPSLRSDAAYRDLVAEEIAHAFGELVTKPDLIDPNSTAICDALVAGDPAPTAEIRGFLWRDDDADDEQNGGDDPVAGVAVELLDTSDDVLATTTSAADGTFGFPRLAAGTYRVRVAASEVFTYAAQDASGDDTTDSDVSVTTGKTGDIPLAAHAVVDHTDAGLRLRTGTAQVGDFVWLDDVTVDGIQTSGEGGIAGVQVTLEDADGVALETDVTDGGGYFLFNALPDGDYVLRFAPQAGYQPAPAGQGGDPSLDSDIDASGAVSVTLAAAQTDLNVDAGYRLNCLDATLVAYGSEWKRSTSSQTDWHTRTFNDGGWTEQQGSLGYGVADVETSFTDGGSAAYFRIAFEIEDPTIFDSLDLALTRTDGAVVYLNDTEVLSSNVPVVTTGKTEVFHTIQSPGLVQGTNVLAVEVHESSTEELFFDLELSATLCRPCLATVDLELVRGTYVRTGSSASRGDYENIGMDGNAVENGLLAWDVSGLPSDAEVLHAEVEVQVTEDSDDVFHVYPMATAWDEDGADWTHADDSVPQTWSLPGASHSSNDYEGDEPLASLKFDVEPPEESSYAGYVVLNVSGRELVQSWIRGTRANDGVIIPGDGEGDSLDFKSDDTSDPPVLRLVYRSCSP